MLESDSFMSQDQDKIKLRRLTRDVSLLPALGEVVTIQIDLLNGHSVAEELREEFDDSEDQGLYIDNMILQRIMENREYDYYSILEKVVDIVGDTEAIDSITALIRIQHEGHQVEVTLQILGDNTPPQMVQITDQDHYFDLINLIQTRWQFIVARSVY